MTRVDASAHATPQRPWHRQIAAAVFEQAIVKAIGIPVFIGLFFVAYFYLLRNPAYPTTEMPILWLDRLIDFQPLALPLYLSVWVYVSLPPALLETRRQLLSYSKAMAGTCLAGLIVFYFWPTAVPVANIDWAQSPDVAFLKSIDASGNACPSLHVATAVFSGMWLHHALRRFGAPPWMTLFNWTWCAGIAYSTLATRQHVAVDVLAGLVLGGMTAWFSLRRRTKA